MVFIPALPLTDGMFLCLNICICKQGSDVMINELNEIMSMRMHGKQTWEEISSKTH